MNIAADYLRHKATRERVMRDSERVFAPRDVLDHDELGWVEREINRVLSEAVAQVVVAEIRNK